MPNGVRTPMRERIKNMSAEAALGVLADGIEDARNELLTEIGGLRDDVAGFREEARSSRRLTWTVAGSLLTVLGLVLAVAQAVGQ